MERRHHNAAWRLQLSTQRLACSRDPEASASPEAASLVHMARCALMSAAAIRTGADRTRELLSRQVGRSLSEVETPVAVVDLDRLDANLRDLQSYTDQHGIALWPHTKTHK